MKILITGASGYVGQGLMRFLASDGNELMPTGFTLNDESGVIHNLDLNDFLKTDYYIRSIHPDLILHLAGSKDLVKCESDKLFSRRINYDVSENIVKLCSAQKIRLVYISTDYVFSGEGAPFNERSETNPTTQYGQDKLATENFVKDTLKDYAIVRTAGIFGLKNDFVDTLLKEIKAGNSFKAYANLTNSPTFIKDLASMISIVINRGKLGTFHCAGSESLSRYSFALKVAKVFQLDEARIVSENIDLSRDIRPGDLSMECRQTYKTLNYQPGKIEEILRLNSNIWL